MDAPLLQSARELARAIRAGEQSSTDVVECHIRRIERVNPSLNALVRERFEQARQEAKAADARRAREDPDALPPLLGVPCTIKESIALAGMPNSSGVVSRAGVIAETDAPPVARLRAAGAIPLGVTNTSEITAASSASNRLYGRTCNAYHPGHSPGGSSGGEGAIVGAGGSPFGIGTDIGGSIRGPAFCNGVFGHKPSGGLVPGTGQYPSYEGLFQRMNTTGPLARRAEDLMPLLRIIAGPDGVEAGCTAQELGDPAAVDFSKLRVFVAADRLPGSRLHPELERARQNAAYTLAGRGARVEMRSFPPLRASGELFLGTVIEAGGLPLETFLGDGTPVHAGRELLRAAVGQSPHTATVLASALGLKLLGRLRKRYARLAERARAFGAELATLLGDDGVLLVPSALTTPPRLRFEFTGLAIFAWFGLWNALELPATQVPLGLGSRGLPLGVQVVGAHGGDHVTIAVAQELERAGGGWQPPARFD